MARKRSPRGRGWRTAAVGALALAAGGCGDDGGNGDPNIRIEQPDFSQRLESRSCPWRDFPFKACARRGYPRTDVARILPAPAARFTVRFPSTGRVEVHAFVLRGGRARRIDWEGTVQCADSACVSELVVPDGFEPRLPARADGLRILVPRQTEPENVLDGVELLLPERGRVQEQ